MCPNWRFLEHVDQRVLVPGIDFLYIMSDEVPDAGTTWTSMAFRHNMSMIRIRYPPVRAFGLTKLSDVKKMHRPWREPVHGFEYSYATKLWPLFLVTRPEFRDYVYWFRIDEDVRFSSTPPWSRLLSSHPGFLHTNTNKSSKDPWSVERGMQTFINTTDCAHVIYSQIDTYQSNFIFGDVHHFTQPHFVNLTLRWFDNAKGWSIRWSDQQLWPLLRQCYLRDDDVADAGCAGLFVVHSKSFVLTKFTM